jgi:5-methylcytosine-specific restriction endonuclease McrA
MALPVPLVIRLVYFVRIPRRMNIPCTRRTVLLRDNYTCQYCGDHPSRAQLTLDHVVPRVQGGETTWDNVVCACKRCNLRKGGRTPEEAHMRLRKKPSRPRYMGMVVLSQAASHEAWRKYVPGGLAMEGEVA